MVSLALHEPYVRTRGPHLKLRRAACGPRAAGSHP